MTYIDISEHQGYIDWAKLQASKKVDGVMIRAGYGQNNIDKWFVSYITECNRRNIPCGVYWFSYAYTPAMAVQEATYCLKAIKPYKLQLPVAFDFEYDSVNYARKMGVTMTKSLATSIAEAFLSTIEAANYYAMNYAGPDFLANYFDASLSNKYDLWLAWYTGAKTFEQRPNNCGIWQYTSTGTMLGIDDYVDMNYSYLDYPTIIAGAGLNNSEPEEWYETARKWAVENDISDGSRPLEVATRAEVWTMLKRLMEKN